MCYVSDVTDVALEWAGKNVKSNPHVSQLIEIRKVESVNQTVLNGEVDNDQPVDTGTNIIGSTCGEEEGFNSSSLDVNKSYCGPPVNIDSSGIKCGEEQATSSSSLDVNMGVCKSYCGPPVLLGVVKDGERFDFCMCNPPFFESMEEAGLNPKTACGGTPEEMVCPGGEQAFITRIIEDSVVLKQSFWYQTRHSFFLFLFLFFKVRLPHVKVLLYIFDSLSVGGIHQWLVGKLT